MGKTDGEKGARKQLEKWHSKQELEAYLEEMHTDKDTYWGKHPMDVKAPALKW